MVIRRSMLYPLAIYNLARQPGATGMHGVCTAAVLAVAASSGCAEASLQACSTAGDLSAPQGAPVTTASASGCTAHSTAPASPSTISGTSPPFSRSRSSSALLPSRSATSFGLNCRTCGDMTHGVCALYCCA
jgi:hypothetical protein